jgi:hypothetical protein
MVRPGGRLANMNVRRHNWDRWSRLRQKGCRFVITIPAAYLRDKPITIPGYRLYEPRPLDVFPQYRPDLAYRCIDSVFGINKNIFAPQSLDNFLPTHNLPVAFKQEYE